jgi:hypothetical protein
MYWRNLILQDYVLASADKRLIALGASEAIDLFHKDEQGKWDVFNYQAGDLVELASIGLKFPIEDVCQEIIFEHDNR